MEIKMSLGSFGIGLLAGICLMVAILPIATPKEAGRYQIRFGEVSFLCEGGTWCVKIDTITGNCWRYVEYPMGTSIWREFREMPHGITKEAFFEEKPRGFLGD